MTLKSLTSHLRTRLRELLTFEEEYIYTEEPHTSRRQAILKSHPELKKLMGHDSTIVYYVLVMFAFQMLVCHFIHIYDPSVSFLAIAFTWAIGGSINHSLAIAIHEATHNLVFGHRRVWANRVFSIFANFAQAIPMASSMKKFHADHHRWLGHDYMDVDVPTGFDTICFKSRVTKVLWLFFNLLVQGIRPFMKTRKVVTNWEIYNFLAQALFDVLLYKVFGGKALLYLFMGTFLGMGLHPLTSRIITEHYLITGSRFETQSYYGSGNYIMFNVGYHVEHHDFPYIPHNRLHMVRKMAPEYYEDLPYHTSYWWAMWKFITDPTCGPVWNALNDKFSQKLPESLAKKSPATVLPLKPGIEAVKENGKHGLANGNGAVHHHGLANGNGAVHHHENGVVNGATPHFESAATIIVNRGVNTRKSNGQSA